jgi:ketosteroid isomerase-like protein
MKHAEKSKEVAVKHDESTTEELLALSRRLLESIAAADWETYATLCDPSLSAFEPESQGHLVEGIEFHRFYFNLGASPGPCNITLVAPHVRVMGDAAVVSYVRLTQRCDAGGTPAVSRCEETRVWQRSGGRWRHVHFHRSTVR